MDWKPTCGGGEGARSYCKSDANRYRHPSLVNCGKIKARKETATGGGGGGGSAGKVQKHPAASRQPRICCPSFSNIYTAEAWGLLGLGGAGS